MMNASRYRDLLARTPVDELEVTPASHASFRVDELTWMTLSCVIRSRPREAGRQDRLIQIARGSQCRPRKIMFPKGNAPQRCF